MGGLIDRLRCQLGQQCKCSEPEEAWICAYSYLPTGAFKPGHAENRVKAARTPPAQRGTARHPNTTETEGER
jgi:hypothetical protein